MGLVHDGNRTLSTASIMMAENTEHGQAESFFRDIVGDNVPSRRLGRTAVKHLLYETGRNKVSGHVNSVMRGRVGLASVHGNATFSVMSLKVTRKVTIIKRCVSDSFSIR